jgi:BirA family transcriptional regulator, biotin operon repressor / biotin---[acetyl-CoA-carboxylase] ligase
MSRFNDVRRFGEIDSTNRWVAEQARGGVAEGLVAVAEMQSAGRGRLDRTWIAPAGSALLCTVLVRPRMPMARWHWLNLAMAVAAQDAIRMLGGSFNGGAEGGTRGIGRLTNTQSHEFEAPGMVAAAGLDVAVKWPNDLIVPSMGDRKLAGILAEMVLPANGEGAVVVGIGLNVRRPLDVDSEVAARGVWLNELLSAHMNNLDSGAGTELDTPRSSVDISLSEVQASSPSVDDVMNVLLSEFERQVAEVEDRPDAFLETYRQRCITVGRHVRAMLPSSDIVGTATGIDSDGQLLVTTADGTTHTISAADVVHIRPVSQS